MLCVILIIVTCGVLCGGANFEYNEPCTINGINGVCTTRSTCRSTLEQLGNTTSQRVGFDGGAGEKENQCGTVNLDITEELIIGGMEAKRGEVPWHAGIYTKTTRPYMQICGGSLIRSNVIISAAHCFWSELKKQLPADNYAVAVGKLYRPWVSNLTKEVDQKSDVKEIYLPLRYQGNEANHQEDIAIVLSTREFKYTRFVRPVCIDFDDVLEKKQLQPGNNGTVAGWGLISDYGGASQVLKVITLPNVDIRTCISESPYTYRPHITSDKICAGIKGSSLAMCKGDSGGGLAFPELFNGKIRYILRGIVSTAPTSEDNRKCNADEFTSFTNLQKHEDFIKEIWDMSSSSAERLATTQLSGFFGVTNVNFQEYVNSCRLDDNICCLISDKHGTVEIERGCGWSHPQSIVNTANATSSGEAQYGELPWMCAVLETTTRTDYITGEVTTSDVFFGNGALIHPAVVVVNLIIRPGDNPGLKVRAGIWNGGSATGLHAHQLRDVASVETGSSPYALLFLTKPMTPALNVGVACLAPAGQRVPPGTTCVAAQWVHTQAVEYNYQTKLRKVDLLAMERVTCERLHNETVGYRADRMLDQWENCVSQNKGGHSVSEKTCVDISWGSHLSCAIKSQNDRYMLSGIFKSFTPCKTDPFWVYYDISAARTWIDEKVTARGYDPKTYTIDPK